MNKIINLFPSKQADDCFFPKFRSVINIDVPWHGDNPNRAKAFPLRIIFLELTAYDELPPEWIKTLIVKITIGDQKIVLTDITRVTGRRWGPDGLYHIGVETAPVLAKDYPPDARFHLFTQYGYEWSTPLHQRLNRV